MKLGTHLIQHQVFRSQSNSLAASTLAFRENLLARVFRGYSGGLDSLVLLFYKEHNCIEITETRPDNAQ